MIVGGSGNVFIGGGTTSPLPIQSEVPEWVRWAAVVIGLLPALGGAGDRAGAGGGGGDRTRPRRADRRQGARTTDGNAGGASAAARSTSPFPPKKVGELAGAIPITP